MTDDALHHRRRTLLRFTAAAPALVAMRGYAQTPATTVDRPFELAEATVADLQASMRSGQRTSVSIAQAYLARMDAVDRGGPVINAVIERNPDALDIARGLDRERREKGLRQALKERDEMVAPFFRLGRTREPERKPSAAS